MPLNPNIALSVKPFELEDPINQFAKYTQIQQAQNQNALAQIQFQNAQRAQTNALAQAEAYKNSYDPVTGKVDTNKLLGYLASGGQGAAIPGVQKGLLEADKLQNDIAKGQIETKAKTVDLAQSKMKSFKDDLVNINDYADAVMWVTRQHKDKDLTPITQNMGTLDQSLKNIPTDPTKLKEWRDLQAMGIDKFNQLIEERKRTRISEGNLNVARGNLSLANRKFAADMNPEVQANLAKARASGELTGKAQATAAQNLQNIKDATDETLRGIRDLIGDAYVEGGKIIKEGQAPHPGFSMVGDLTGPLVARYPGTAATGFKKRVDQLKGGAFLTAFEALKGGGAITEVEGVKGTEAINRMDTATSEVEFVQAARDFERIVKKGLARANAKTGGAAVAKSEEDVFSKYGVKP